MTSRRRAIIFDLYGTLVDVKVDEKRITFWKAVAADFFGEPPSITGTHLRDRFLQLANDSKNREREGFLLDKLFATLLTESGLSPSKRTIEHFASVFRRHSLVRLQKKRYLDTLLRRIRVAGYKLGLISNTEALLTQYDLRRLALPEQFDNILMSSTEGVKKPDGRIFRKMLARLSVRCDEAVFVGDNFEEDILGAQRCGIDGIYLTRHDRDRVKAQLCDGKKVICVDFRLRSIVGALRRYGFSV